MTWSYSSEAPGTVDLDWVRLRIGDTDSSDQLLQDEEIQALLDSESSRHLAAIMACETIAAKFARQVDKTVGKLSLSMSQAADRYTKMADRLRRELGVASAGVYAGGISVSDKADQNSDTDRVDPAFYVGQFDYVDPSS